MSARPPSPRSLQRARGGRYGTARTATTITTGVVAAAAGAKAATAVAAAAAAAAAGTSDEDELMTINENRNGHGPTDYTESNANASNSSLSSSSSESIHSYGDIGLVLLEDEGPETSGLHPMDGGGFQTVEHERPLVNGCEDMWSWNKRDRSKEVWLSRSDNRRVYFHPNWSKGTAGIRGTRVLNNGRYYWEISLSQRVFGTR
uniref:B30.2/SPRY domain-containing protein n=1 Tax=Anopheles epiroticus TaxID=199890 RepID=A0A182PU50_9DIPT